MFKKFYKHIQNNINWVNQYKKQCDYTSELKFYALIYSNL